MNIKVTTLDPCHKDKSNILYLDSLPIIASTVAPSFNSVDWDVPILLALLSLAH